MKFACMLRPSQIRQFGIYWRRPKIDTNYTTIEVLLHGGCLPLSNFPKCVELNMSILKNVKKQVLHITNNLG